MGRKQQAIAVVLLETTVEVRAGELEQFWEKKILKILENNESGKEENKSEDSTIRE